MKNKLLNKLIIVLITIFCLFPLITIKSHAGIISDIFTKADEFVEKGDASSATTIKEDTLKEMSDVIYNVLLIIGIVVAVIVGMVIGIKFMTGSAEQKAKVKETLIPYVAGCIVVFGAFTIWKVIVTIIQSVPSA